MPLYVSFAPVTALKNRVRLWVAVKVLTMRWIRESRRTAECQLTGSVKHLLILPSDPWTLVGSKGDEAMMRAVVQQLLAVEPQLKVTVVTATDEANSAARQLGFESVNAWSEPWNLKDTVTRLISLRPDAMVTLGADVMDGYYSPLSSLRLLATADLLVRRGVRGALLGFSFNETPNRQLKYVFDRVCVRLAVNVRDGISFERFRKFSSASALLVADAAFMLDADERSSRVLEIAAWVKRRRANGDIVIAFNIHPMLIRQASDVDVKTLTDSAIEALERFTQSRPVSLLFLAHDYRVRDGDDVCLEPVHLALQNTLEERILYPRNKMCAAELKAISGLVDGVVTGRMHLAIASLGMGVPVAALTYQDKFHGLFDHFGLPSSLLLKPQDAMRPEMLFALLGRFVAQLPQLRETVATALPRVRTASRKNLRGLLPNFPL